MLFYTNLVDCITQVLGDVKFVECYSLSLGAQLYRGPMDLENGHRICQVLDPYGNSIGIRGRKNNTAVQALS